MRRLGVDLGSQANGAWLGRIGLLASLIWMASASGALAQQEGGSEAVPEPSIEAVDEVSAETDLTVEQEAREELEAEAAGAEGQPQRRKDVEEIRVTGRRREEALQEVPISIRAFDAAEIEARQITRLDQIGFGTANLSFDATNGSNRDARIYIRGIGQDDPRTIVDPAIGIYVDNVYIPRVTNALFDVVDIDRIEVLRGPQGTLYGKNTIGGVINVVTRKPGHELGADLSLNVGSYNLLEFRGSVDVPVRAGWLDDKLFTRLMIATGTEDGYTTNLVDGEHAGDNKLLSVRGSFQFYPRDDLVFDLVVDWAEQNERAVIGKCALGNPFNIARYVTDNFSGEGPGDRFTDWCEASADFGPHAGWAQPLGKTYTDTVGTSFIGTYNPSEWLEVKSITGFRQRWENQTGADLDGTPVFYIGSQETDDTHWAVSEDLNFTVNLWDDRFNMIVGGYIFHEEGDEEDISDVLREMALGLDPEFEAEVYANAETVLNSTVGFANTPVWVGLGLINDPNVPGDTSGDEFWRNAIKWGIGELNRIREQQWENQSYAAYTHTDIEIIHDVILQGGVRYTNETKTRQGADQRIYYSEIPDPDNLVLPLVITPPQLPYGGGTRRVVLPQTFDCGNYVGELANGDLFYYTVDCDRWTPEAGIKWQITDEHMGYFRYAQGWKSGGLRQEALTEQTNNSKRFVEPYLPETVNSFEVGVRTQWLDNQLFLNGTYFYNDYDNMQVTSLEPNDVGLVTALINNAESAVTQGFELEGAYRPDWAEKIPLTASTIGLTFGVGLTDAHYNKFVGTTVPNPTDTTGCDNLARGDCSDLIVDTFAVNTVIFPVLGPLGFVDYPETVSVDLSGNQFKNTPRWNANASLTYAFDPMSEATLSFRLDWSYRSTVYYTTVNSDLLKSDPLNLLNGAVTLDVHSTQSQIVFWVKNLTDEVYLNGALDLGEALGANGLYYSQGRTFGIRFLQSF